MYNNYPAKNSNYHQLTKQYTGFRYLYKLLKYDNSTQICNWAAYWTWNKYQWTMLIYHNELYTDTKNKPTKQISSFL